MEFKMTLGADAFFYSGESGDFARELLREWLSSREERQQAKVDALTQKLQASTTELETDVQEHQP